MIKEETKKESVASLKKLKEYLFLYQNRKFIQLFWN